MKFFKEENFKIIVDPEVKVIKEFRNLIAKDKDRNKRNAVMWFAYIFYMNDYRSSYYNYPQGERHTRVCDAVGLPLDFKPFREVEEATAKYWEFQETAAVRSLISIKEGLITSARVIDMLKNRTETMLDTIMADEGYDDDTAERIDQVTKGVVKMLELSDKLPKAINTITSLEEEVKREQANESKIRGGGKKGDFED